MKQNGTNHIFSSDPRHHVERQPPLRTPFPSVAHDHLIKKNEEPAHPSPNTSHYSFWTSSNCDQPRLGSNSDQGKILPSALWVSKAWLSNSEVRLSHAVWRVFESVILYSFLTCGQSKSLFKTIITVQLSGPGQAGTFVDFPSSQLAHFPNCSPATVSQPNHFMFQVK